MFKVHSFKIDSELIKKIKVLCAYLDISMASFVNDAIRKHLADIERNKKKEDANESIKKENA